MKIILLQDVKTLGKKGDVVEVSAGYARNMILPKKLGVEATAKNLNDLKLQNQHADKVAQENLEKAQELAKDLEGKVVEVKIKTGEGGKIFGSVSTKEIAAAAKEQIGFALDKKKMQLEEPIRSLGYHDVPIRLHTKGTGTLRVKETEEEKRRILMEESVIKRVMPNSLEAEQSVIGSMIMDREAVMAASEILTTEDFYHKQYGILFEAMLELFNDGQPVDLVTLQNRLKEKNVPPEVSSLEYVGNIVAAVPTSANIKYYANIVKEKALLRELIRTTEGIENAAYAQKDPVEDILADTEKSIFTLLQNQGGGDYVPIKDVVLNALEKIQLAAKTKGNVTGIPTGFIDLDYKMSGLQPSDLILVAARPSMGKTAFVLNIAQYVAFHEDECTAIFSLEMSKEQLVNRLFALESHVDAQLLRSGNLADSDWEKLIEGAGTIGKSKLIIDDTPGISISELRSKCRKYKLEHDLKLIIIDYLQLMSGSGRGSDSRQQEISDISRSLKSLARELNVPVIALSQLSRAVEQRPEHRPMLSDLRESGAIEQDADVVMFIYRDDYYNKDSDMKGIAEINIAKQRNGPIGTVNLVWLPQYTKFANMEKQ